MIDFIRNKIIGKKILILGYGREGESTLRFFEKYFPGIKLAVADMNDTVREKINSKDVETYTGEGYLDCIKNFDLIFKTPGISLNHFSIAFDRNKITSQTDLFIGYYHHQVIGITGTKGKSTTSSLIYHIIKQFTDDVVLVGNIGVPPFDMIEEIKPATRIVFELSSHQLEYISRAPHIAVLLNLFQEHLDHYKSFDDYKRAKLNSAKFQRADDYFVFNADDHAIMDMLPDVKSAGKHLSYSMDSKPINGCFVSDQQIYFNVEAVQTSVYNLQQERNLKGEHNIMNIMAAVCSCKISGIPNKSIVDGICTFKGLEHRIEYVGRFECIEFYNDSIATIPEATIEAVKTLKNVETLILGGYDRGVDYSVLSDFFAKSMVKNILFMGKAGERMMALFEKHHNEKTSLVYVVSLQDAVMYAKQHTSAGGICLLSPAAASYDCFKNFEERGEAYKKIVRTQP